MKKEWFDIHEKIAIFHHTMKSQTLQKIRRLEAKASRLWETRTLSPQSWQNITANALWERAQALRKSK